MAAAITHRACVHAEARCEKFSDRYGILPNVSQRAYRKALGKANARLLFADLKRDDSRKWLPMGTDGEHAAHTTENLKDALVKGGRAHVSGYELLKVRHSKQSSDDVRLTWRMTTETQRQLRYHIRTTVRAQREDQQVAGLAHSLYQTPGFHPTRYQVSTLVAFFARNGRTPVGARAAVFAKRVAIRATHGR